MNHIVKLRKMSRWLVIYLCYPLVPAALVAVITLAMGLGMVFSDGPVEIFRALGALILTFPVQTVQFLLILTAVLFLLGRAQDELSLHRARLDKRGRYIRMMEEALQKAKVEFRRPEDVGSKELWSVSARETRWLRRVITAALVVLWIQFGLGLVQFLQMLPEVKDLNYGDGSFLMLLLLLAAAAEQVFRLWFTVYAQKNALPEAELLEMSLREQRYYMEKLEEACSRAEIPMEGIWKAAGKTK